MTCGEGGAIITNDSELYERIQQSILHGMSAGAADRFKLGQYKHWEMSHLGTKANLPDILACLLPNQIKDIDSRLKQRELICNRYEQAFVDTKIKFPGMDKKVIHSRHLFPIFVGAKSRDAALIKLGENGIGATVNYRAVTTMDYYSRKYGFQSGFFPVSENWGSGTLSIPLFPSLKTSSNSSKSFFNSTGLDEIDYIIETMLTKINPLINED